MELAAQLMLGMGLAACAGLRAWLPLLLLSVMARTGYITLGAGFEFLAREDALVILGVATIIEVVADKVVGLDHLLDAVGTIARPAAGAVLASAVLVNLDPLAAAILGLIAGGASSLLVHSSKSIVRAKTTALVPIHGGAGNAVVSTAEDMASGAGAWMILSNPAIAVVVVVPTILIGGWIVYRALRGVRSLRTGLRRRSNGAHPALRHE